MSEGAVSAKERVETARVDGVLIDLDGTLVDSVPDLATAVNRMLQDLGLDAHPESAVRRWVGNGAQRLVERSLTGDFDARPERQLLERAMALFLEHYRDHLSERSCCYPGVVEGLERLYAAGLALGCVTNKPAAFTEPLLVDLGIRDRFGVVVSGDTLAEKKPDPAPLLHAARALGVAPGRCAVIGDSASDIRAARAAGCVCVCVGYGYNQGMNLSSLGPDYLVDDFTAAVDRVFLTDPT